MLLDDRGHRRVLFADRLEPGKALRVAGADHVVDDPAALGPGQKPEERGTEHAGADEHVHRAHHVPERAICEPALGFKEGCRAGAPVATGDLGPTGDPSLLEALAGLFLQPVEQAGQSAPAEQLERGPLQS